MVTVKIYNGSHYGERVLLEYTPPGSYDVVYDFVEEGARSMCGSLKETAGRRIWVDFLDDNGYVLFHRIFQEG